MSSRRAVIAGASGFIGRALVAELAATGWSVTRLVRGPATGADEISWNPLTGVLDPAVLSGADAVINLSGASISQIPWTRSARESIVASRREATTTLVNAINAAKVTPKVFLSGSAVGIYGDRGDEELTETSARGTGFLADVVDAWEATASKARCRTVYLRTGLVLGDGGALAPLRLATSFFAGARVGSGKQWWPWISHRDEVRAIVHLIDSKLAGAVNLVGPTPAHSVEVTRELARIMTRPHLFVIPAFAIGLLGDAGRELLLASQKIRATALEKDGFVFEHRTVAEALRWVISGTRR
ncbi:MAG: TIGR01777 family oxidoreductase [Microbacteriaceae bacterium]|nr:TIGR01777 family oxidoreductase [Microbacteriaceae bacterium]